MSAAIIHLRPESVLSLRISVEIVTHEDIAVLSGPDQEGRVLVDVLGFRSEADGPDASCPETYLAKKRN